MRTYSKTVTHTYQRTGMRCGKCDTPFIEDMEVNIPLDRYAKQMQSISCPSCGSKKLFLGMGLSLTEDRQRRIAGGSIPARLDDWNDNGETGMSSSYVAAFMQDGNPKQVSHPHDYDDLRRVLLLLDRIPEWNERMHELSEIPGWANIASRWNEIREAVAAADPELRRPTQAEGLLAEVFGR